jgi:hypothetical protein
LPFLLSIDHGFGYLADSSCSEEMQEALIPHFSIQWVDPFVGAAPQRLPPVDISLDLPSISRINQRHTQYKSVKTDQADGVLVAQLDSIDRAVFGLISKPRLIGG